MNGNYSTIDLVNVYNLGKVSIKDNMLHVLNIGDSSSNLLKH